MKTLSLYQRMKAAGVDLSSHESDLYVESTETSRAILADFPLQKSNAMGFRNQIDGKAWIDIPFAYDPFWNRKPTVKR